MPLRSYIGNINTNENRGNKNNGAKKFEELSYTNWNLNDMNI